MFRLEVSVGVFAFGGEGHALDAGFVTRLKIDDLRPVALALDPAGIHAKQHFGPVLGFGPAGTGVDGDDGIAVVVFAVQHEGQRKAFNGVTDAFEGRADFRQGGVILFLDGHLQQHFAVFDLAGEGVKLVDFGGQPGPFPQQGLGLFRIVPEAFLGNDGFDFLEAVFLGGEVKDSPGSGGGGCGLHGGFV